jgi:hypothetical protein
MSKFIKSWIYELKNRPEEFLPRIDLFCLHGFIAGCDTVLQGHGIPLKSMPCQDFGGWLRNRLRFKVELGPFSLLTLTCTNEQTAFNLFFMYLDEFLEEQRYFEPEIVWPLLKRMESVEYEAVLDAVSKRPVLYLSTKGISPLFAFFAGVRFAGDKLSNQQVFSWLPDFQRWLHSRLGFPDSCTTRGMALMESGNDEAEAFDKFFMFRAEWTQHICE